jgi:hypothetical protein
MLAKVKHLHFNSPSSGVPTPLELSLNIINHQNWGETPYHNMQTSIVIQYQGLGIHDVHWEGENLMNYYLACKWLLQTSLTLGMTSETPISSAMGFNWSELAPQLVGTCNEEEAFDFD